MAMILTAVLEGPTPLATKHADTSLAVNTELRVATRQGQVREFEMFSRSGNCQGIL